MEEMFFCVTADDVAMDGYSTPEHLDRLVRFWEDEGLKGTLFTVPRWEGRELGERADYVTLLKDVAARGHEVGQHGLDHGRFQTGIPPQMILDLPHEGPARKHLAEHRAEIEGSLTVTNLRKTLCKGREILETALDIPIKGFRAPAGAICAGLFDALVAEGYAYDSSKILQESAWDLIIDPDQPVAPRPITRARFVGFQPGNGLRIWPIVAEYTWYLTRAHYDTFLALAKHDFDACLATGLPYVPVCHISPVHEGDAECGLDLYRALLAYARERTAAAGRRLVCVTCAELCERWNAE